MMKLRVFTITVFLFLILIDSPFAKESLIMNGTNYAPYIINPSTTFECDESKMGGILFDLLVQFQKQNFQYSIIYRNYPRRRVNEMLKRGEEIDLFFNSPLFTDEETKKYYNFSAVIFHTRDVVVSRKKDNFIYKSPKDLYGKRVATIRGFGYGAFDPLLKNGIIKDDRSPGNENLIQKLKYGRIDVFFGNIHVTPYYMKKMGMDMDEFRFSKKSLLEFNLLLVIRKDKKSFYKDFNKFVVKSRKNGLINRLEKKYIF